MSFVDLFSGSLCHLNNASCYYAMLNMITAIMIVLLKFRTAKMIRAIIMGAPGSGKGTISSMMVQTFGLQYISSSDLLRSHRQSPMVQQAMRQGELVPDNVMEELVLPELKKHPHWLLDGYPRTLAQAKSLVKQQEVDVMISLDVPDRTIVERLQGRWIHVSSGRIYNSEYNQPKVMGVDDVTGEPLEQRKDDRPDIVQQRLNTYHSITNPVLEFFKDLGLLRVYTGTESTVLWRQIKEDVTKLMR